MPQGYDQLSVTRVNGIAEVINEQLAIPASLKYLNLIPVIDGVDEGEVMGYHEQRIVSAEIIPDDQAARVHQGGRIYLETNAIPNLKTGSLINQATMNLLRRINRGGGIPGDGGIISNYSRREVANNIAGVRILMNRMLAGMLIDDWSYRKNGVTIKNVSWGMPQSHKFVPAISWTLANRATATPVQDILLWKKSLETDLIFSETFDTLIGSSTMFNNIIATDDFRNAARPFTPYALDTTTFQQIKLNNKLAGELFTTITGVRFDFDNAAFADELNDGSTKTERYLAENVGAFVNSADFDNGTYDFANTIVNETQVGDLAGTTIIGGGFPAPQSGPVAYATITPDLNPPNIRLWAVARGFPRKHRKTAGARVTAW